MKFYIRGGVGDFLQCSWFASTNNTKEFIIHTHFKNAKDIFEEIGLANSFFYFFNNIEEHDDQVDKILENHGENSTTNIRECPRAFYSDISFSQKSKNEASDFIKNFKNENPIIGIHPFGSGFSEDTYGRFNLPKKHLPLDIVKKIINSNYNYIIFGAKEELSSYGLDPCDNILLTDMGMTSCLETVKLCSKFIGTDSCFKTMSAMSKIPTYCLLGDFKDPIRDSYFIDQYEKDGIMTVFRFKNLDEQSEDLLSSINHFISK